MAGQIWKQERVSHSLPSLHTHTQQVWAYNILSLLVIYVIGMSIDIIVSESDSTFQKACSHKKSEVFFFFFN